MCVGTVKKNFIMKKISFLIRGVKRFSLSLLEGRCGGMWDVEARCAHLDVAVVAYGQGLIEIPLAGPRGKIK